MELNLTDKRIIIADTETTGLSKKFDRITEIGAIEVINFKPTGRFFHSYFYSGRKIPLVVQQITGINNKMLENKPQFHRVAKNFLNFLKDDLIVAHNSDFDMGFINSELLMAGLKDLPKTRFIDTLKIARQKYPGKKNSLDYLCKRMNISLDGREYHGALIDSLLLMQVFEKMVKEEDTLFDFKEISKEKERQDKIKNIQLYARPRPNKLAPLITQEEKLAHNKFVSEIKGSLWQAK